MQCSACMWSMSSFSDHKWTLQRFSPIWHWWCVRPILASDLFSTAISLCIIFHRGRSVPVCLRSKRVGCVGSGSGTKNLVQLDPNWNWRWLTFRNIWPWYRFFFSLSLSVCARFSIFKFDFIQLEIYVLWDVLMEFLFVNFGSRLIWWKHFFVSNKLWSRNEVSGVVFLDFFLRRCSTQNKSVRVSVLYFYSWSYVITWLPSCYFTHYV